MGNKKEITAEKLLDDFIKKTGLTKEIVLEKLKEFSKELDNIKTANNVNRLDCPYDFTSRCTMGRCDCKPKV
jgi:hypothetical protein